MRNLIRTTVAVGPGVSALARQKGNLMPTFGIRASGTVGRMFVAATTAGVAALAFASPASAVNIDQYIDVPSCEQPQTQWCKPIRYVYFTTNHERSIKVEFTANRNHCSDIIVHIFFDDAEWGSNRVAPGQSDGGYEIPVTRGEHRIGVQAEGIEGGCNIGYLSAWGGTVHIESLQDPNKGFDVPPPE